MSDMSFHMVQSLARRSTAPFSIAIYLYEPSDGGLDRVAILLANHLVARGIAAELWMARTVGPLASLISPDVTVRQVPSPPITRRWALVAQIPALAAMVRQFRPDILYSAGDQSNLVVALAALGADTRAIGRISNPIVRPGDGAIKAHIRRFRFRVSARLSAMTIVMGASDRDLLAAGNSALADKIHLLPRPTITPELETTGRLRLSEQADTSRELLAVGRLVPQKDYATMLTALARLKHRDWRLRIVGQGPLLAPLQQRCRDLGIADRVAFLGFIDDPAALARLYGEADILLQSSRFEGFCGAVVEALACGCSVVATASTPNLQPWLRRAGQQDMVPIGDAEAYATAIDRALDAPKDRARMIDAVQPLRVDAALDAHIACFSQLCRRAEVRRARSPVDAMSR